ncbi:head completion/stabilization protein [Pseudomonas sp. C9-3]|uniref:head completion/stabilization protein n=1 Tax=Pseudomonas sp. C9-3 TaxID=3078264 RepID=UPI0028E95BD2|nr:head completion/stabilization protein [Pseudomonas sp. C9-3]
MSFVANVGTPGTPPDVTTINSDEFWPGIELEGLRADLRIGQDIPPARLEVAVVGALLNVNRQLRDWQSQLQDQGYTALSQAPAPKVNGHSEKVQNYQRAVRCAVAAELLERYGWYDTTHSGQEDVDERRPSVDDYRRDLAWALSDLCGRRRMTVDLI